MLSKPSFMLPMSAIRRMELWRKKNEERVDGWWEKGEGGWMVERRRG